MRSQLFGLCAFGALAGLTSLVACGSSNSSFSVYEPDAGPGDTTPAPDPTSGDQGPLGQQAGKNCKGLQCQQVECPPGQPTTTVAGTVFAPNGTLPLYNAIVWIPNAKLDPISEGVTCDHCGTVSGEPIATAVTDVAGNFILQNVPVGQDIPLVIQVGKWRREVTIPNVTQCTETKVSADITRLPKNQGEGHIPKIAVTTGRCDQLACLLPKLGLDSSEYTPSTGTGRLHLYRGAADSSGNNGTLVDAPAPAGTTDAKDFWSDANKLKTYDMLMLSCECGEHADQKPAAAIQAVYDFASAGGRVFASHFHYIWGQNNPALFGQAQWVGDEGNKENPGGPFLVDQSFPKGAAFAKWLVNVNAATTLGQIPISQPREDVGNIVSPTQRWVYRTSDPVTSNPFNISLQPTQYMSINTPVGKPVDQQCGKFVYADMHLYGGDVQPVTGALPDDAFPNSCSKDLTPEEKALAFLFFELSACVTDDTKPPAPPPVK